MLNLFHGKGHDDRHEISLVSPKVVAKYSHGPLLKVPLIWMGRVEFMVTVNRE